MKAHKKLVFFILFILLFFLFFFILNTFAKYLSSVSSSANVSIASWNIKVNNVTINENTDISSTIIPVFPGNEHMASNIIAPTAEGYFDLDIDVANVDVSFHYSITSTVADNSPVKDFIITGYSMDNQPKIEFTPEEEKIISEDILLTSGITNRKIRVYIKWIDDSSQTMDNAEDTLAAISKNPAIFNVNINFSQIVD